MRAASHGMWSNATSAVLFLLQCFLSIRAGSASLLQRASTLPSPISFPPAQNWCVFRNVGGNPTDSCYRDGPDGPWSTFTLRVGTPAQDVRVLISTASQSTWVVLPQGCDSSDTSCQDERGATYDYNSSSTWLKQGTFELFNEKNLGLYGNGLWGNDTLGLGIQGSGGPTLNNQVIAGIVTNNFYIGMFGANPKSTNYTGIDGYQQDSYITSLKKQDFIPSITYGYTAGAEYRQKKVLGSFTLGGYDESRFTANGHSFTFAPDDDRDLLVGVQSINFETPNGTTSALLPFGILAYVDSTIPYIYLPLEACKAFEKAFDLKYNATTELYPISDPQHDELIAQNASITFTLSDDVSGGDTINITLPYYSFDLTATFPLVNESTRYFPLKRAANESQYTLGRTFLQEAYLIVDYERNNFSISQCTFKDGSQQKLIGIAPVPSSNYTSPGNKEPSSNRSTVIIGIAVGVSVLVVAIAAVVVSFLLIKKRQVKRREEQDRREKAKLEEENAERVRLGFDKAELGILDHVRCEMEGAIPGPPLAPLAKEKAEYFDAHTGKHELIGGDVQFSELPDQKGPIYEMYGSSTAPVELPADVPKELPTAYPSRRSSALTPSFRPARRIPPPPSPATSPFNDPSEHLSPHSPSSRRSSGQPSPIDRRMGHTPPTRSSTLNSLPFAPSSPSQSGPSSPTDRSMNVSPRSDGILSPISSMRGSEDGLSPTERRPSPSSPRTPPIPTPSTGGSSRGNRSPHIATMRSDDSRRRERRRGNEI